MKWIKRIGLILLLLLVVGGIWLYPKYKMLNHSIHLFDEDRIVENFRSFDKIWPSSEMSASPSPYKYAKSDKMELPKDFNFKGKDYDLKQFLEDSWTTGFLVVQDDQIVFEEYYHGNTEDTRNISWSMAKSFISALFGIAMEEGYIESVMQNVEEYLPELKGSGYEGVKIKDVLQMSTGVGFNEDYGDFNSDINKWGRGFALGNSQNEFAASLKRETAPGTVNHYVSINTHVLGMILVKATGKPIAQYMQEKIWHPLGMEYPAYWLIDGSNMEMALGGLNCTVRDYAKIGSLFLHDGHWRGKQLVPAQWVERSLTPDAPHVMPDGDAFGYGYQWWIPESDQGEYMAQGVYNQNIYVNPTTNTVIVKLSANPRFNDRPAHVPSNANAHLALYRSITSQLNTLDTATELVDLETK